MDCIHRVMVLVTLMLLGCAPKAEKTKTAEGEPPSTTTVEDTPAVKAAPSPPEVNTQAAAPAVPSVPPGPVVPPPPPKPSTPTVLTVQTMESLLQDWLDAQNRGDFEGYRDVYAQKFFGIKRSGPRTYRFDRAGWLKDRKRMFRKPVVVKASKRQFLPRGRTGRIQFTQSWSSGRYSDVGLKRLVVVLTPDGPRISREEMVSSTELDPGDSAFRFALVEGAPYVVLGAAPKKIEGTPEFVSTEDYQMARIELPAANYPEFIGRPATLYAGRNVACQGHIERIYAVSIYADASQPEFMEGLDGMEDEGEPGSERVSETDDAQRVWNAGGRFLAGELSVPPAQCGRGNWAVLSGAKPNILPRRNTVSQDVRKAVVDAFGSLKASREIHRSQKLPPSVPWYASEGGNLELAGYGKDSSRVVFVLGDIDAPCASGPVLWAMYRVDRKPGEVQVTLLAQNRSYFHLIAVMDLDGDGQYEFAGDQTAYSMDLYGPKEAGYGVLQSFAIDYWGCDC